MSSKEVGHQFLARLGKKRLRPGGITATNWLLEKGHFSSKSKVLEVACNRGTTAIDLAQRFHCHITGVDMDKKALEEAKENVQKAQLEDYITLMQANAMKLPFEDNSFDVVINEAMLTMLNNQAKSKALKEYHRVLKPGGVLLTHDVSYEDPKTQAILNQLSQTINVHVTPLQLDDWRRLILEAGFSKSDYTHGKMTLMSPFGMIKDEGFVDSVKIVSRGLKKENREQFLNMRRFFSKTGKNLCYIAVASIK
ncbi:class I SAM-dependent methyltransferase [Streptococcus zalophi]|uniref:class I SAM-dependent methyltransferase n=1 Tax=Streptococcus zalophi TaxID=640031 RepID=UPI00215D03DA|nr:class I SAM-dependent methyltransferase [Streptococcus zalophi]MCR8968278.1 class I SAM-dependent methyltransferase [Streptococcus zalophi]